MGTILAVVAGPVAVEPRSASAVPICPLYSLACRPFPPLQVIPTDPRVMPRGLSSATRAPVALSGGIRIFSGVGFQPPALREAVIEVDRDIGIGVAGFPVCSGGSRDIGSVRHRCSDAIIGSGKAIVESSFPELEPVRSPVALTLFNGGMRDGAVVLFVQGILRVPVPRAVAAKVEIRKQLDGRGRVAHLSVPVLAGGNGSLVRFHVSVKRKLVRNGRVRSFLRARCPDGALDLSVVKALFKNEADLPGVPSQTVLKGNLRFPCNPRR